MDCGIPFCHDGCPLGNLIPEWNDLVYRDDWPEAVERLHSTNNFPEFTGRLCPAPCEASCVLGINEDPVTIERIEHEIVERAWSEGWVTPQVPTERTGKTVAVVGSGPAGLAAAQQLARAGHDVTRLRAGRAAGRPPALRHPGVQDGEVGARPPAGPAGGRGSHLRLLDLGRAASARLAGRVRIAGAGREPGAPGAGLLRRTYACCRRPRSASEFDAVVLAGGATLPRRPACARARAGRHPSRARVPEAVEPGPGGRARRTSPITANGKRVVIIGGGDTGADCLGTAHRQGAALGPPARDHGRAAERPPGRQPLAAVAAHLAHLLGPRGGGRAPLLGDDDRVRRRRLGVGARAARPRRSRCEPRTAARSSRRCPGTEFELECELVLLAMGFVGTERRNAVDELGVEVSPRGTVVADASWATNVEGVFVCGDQTRGQSLIVWAIAEGRSCAAAVDRWLMGTTSLPAPLVPGQLALR